METRPMFKDRRHHGDMMAVSWGSLMVQLQRNAAHWVTEMQDDLVLQPLWQWPPYSGSLSRRDRYVLHAPLTPRPTHTHFLQLLSKEIFVLLCKSAEMTGSCWFQPDIDWLIDVTDPSVWCNSLLTHFTLWVSFLIQLSLNYEIDITCV